MKTLLVDGWSVETTADVIRLERSTLEDRLVGRKRLITAIGSLMTALALSFGGLQAPTGIGLIVWPLVGLFVLVAVLGFLAWSQARLAVSTPLTLVLAGQRVTGLREELLTPLDLPFGDIARVELVREPGLTVPIAKLRLVTKDLALRFAGPELILASDDAKAQVPHLAKLAQSLALRLGCPVTLLD